MGNVVHQYVDHSGDQAGQRPRGGPEDLCTEANSPPQDPPQHQPEGEKHTHRSLPADWPCAIALGCRLVDDSLCSRHSRMDSIRDAHRQRAHVVGHHPIGHVHLPLVGRPRPAAVRSCRRALGAHTHQATISLSVSTFSHTHTHTHRCLKIDQNTCLKSFWVT